MASDFIIIASPLSYVLLTLFSLVIGSLLNVIIHRLPVMITQDMERECRHYLQLPRTPKKEINLFFPRSFCPKCERTISAVHNIPLLSFFLLKGRCRYCHEAIALRYPFVELLSVVLALLSAWMFGFTFTLLFVLLFVWLLLCLFFIDLEQRLLPDELTLSLLWLGLIANTASLFTTLPEAVLSSASAYLILWGFIRLYYLITGKIGMGNGDFKLFAAFGAWFGWTQLPFVLLLASAGGAVVGFSYLKIKNKEKDTPIPFGPFLCIAALVSLFWGRAIMHWYLTSFF
jgi:leader peptidase (prepilin peptidase)/N-methyltransferase